MSQYRTNCWQSLGGNGAPLARPECDWAHGHAGGLLGTAGSSGLLGCARNAQRGLVIGAAGAIIGDQMDRQASELEQNVKGARVERVGEGIQVTFESGLLYDFDSEAVKSEARTNLRELANSLDKYPDSDLLILGHTDSVGTSEYNKRLSVRRADAAAEYIISQGVNRSRVGTGGLGEEEPVASNSDEAGRMQNRRVEVAIYASEKQREEARRKAGG